MWPRGITVCKTVGLHWEDLVGQKQYAQSTMPPKEENHHWSSISIYENVRNSRDSESFPEKCQRTPCGSTAGICPRHLRAAPGPWLLIASGARISHLGPQGAYVSPGVERYLRFFNVIDRVHKGHLRTSMDIFYSISWNFYLHLKTFDHWKDVHHRAPDKSSRLWKSLGASKRSRCPERDPSTAFAKARLCSDGCSIDRDHQGSPSIEHRVGDLRHSEEIHWWKSDENSHWGVVNHW